MTEAELIARAVKILRKANRDHPADTVLRQELREAKSVSRQDSQKISRMVFGFHRWLGWLDFPEPDPGTVKSALGLSQRFAAAPESFSDAEFVFRAVPGWASEHMEVPSGWLRSLQTEPPLWVRARSGQREPVMKALGYWTCFPSRIIADAFEYRGNADLFRTAQFQNGLFELQDISSQVVGLLCDPQPGQTWWDACAGEGGKTLHLSDRMQNKGLIWATDRAEWRLKRLKQRAARAKAFNFRAASWDGSNRLPTKTKFDGILIDAPCSGVGTWQRNPHARWTTTPQDVAELAELQLALLVNAAGSLKPGGKLVYSVCTLTRAETIEVAERFEKQVPDLKRHPIRNPLSPSTPAEHLQIWPQDHGGNGMFVAIWQKK